MSKDKKPDIYSYHDHLSFLRDWFSYMKKTDSNFTVRSFAQKCSIAVGLVPMILNGTRELTEKSFLKILPQLKLSAQEEKFFTLLRLVGVSPDHETRLNAINQMFKLKRFQDSNSKDLRVFEYLTKWYYVAIRELVAIPGFVADADWIASKLRGRISKLEVANALSFLIEHNYIAQDPMGGWRQVGSELDCREGLFKLSLGEFHRQMLTLASEAIEEVPREQRYIIGHTLALSKDDFLKIKEILDRSIENMKELSADTATAKAIYHIEIAAFPLTVNKGE